MSIIDILNTIAVLFIFACAIWTWIFWGFVFISFNWYKVENFFIRRYNKIVYSQFKNKEYD